MAEHDEEAKKKAESDDGNKKKKKEPKKSKKEDGNDETNELAVEGKDKKKAKSKKEKSDAAPLDEIKSPKPKKGKKLASSDHEVKDDKLTERKKKEDREPGHDEKADDETGLKSDAHVQTKAKKKKGVTAETSEEGNGQAESPGEPPSKDATPVQTKTKSKKSKKVVSDDDSIPKSKDTEETVEGETTLKDAPSSQPKMKKRKSKKNIMAESSDDELEIKSDHVRSEHVRSEHVRSDHVRKKKGKKHDLTANDEETEAKTKVKKGKKKHTASEISGENAENTKKKKKKRSSEILEVADSATMEPSAQSNETTPIFSLPTTARALDDPKNETPSEQSTKSEVAADNTADSGSHIMESRPADSENSPSDIPTILEKETPAENISLIAETEKGAGQVIAGSTDNKGAYDNPNSTQEVNEEPSPNKTSEVPSADIVVGDAMTVNASMVAHHKGTAEEDVETPSEARGDTETKANFESHLTDSVETDTTSVEPIASDIPESTTALDVDAVLSDVVPSLVTEGDHPPSALAEERTSDGNMKQEVPQLATAMAISDEGKESQFHDVLKEGFTSTQTAPVTEAANLGEASESGAAVATGNSDSLEVPSESNVVLETTGILEGEPQGTLGQAVVPNQVELDLEANVSLKNTNGQEAGVNVSALEKPGVPNDESRSGTALVEPDVVGAPVNSAEKDSLEETTAIITVPTEPEHDEIEMPKQTSDQVAYDGSPSLETTTGTIDSQEPNIQDIPHHIPQNEEVLDRTSVHEETSASEVAVDANNEDIQGENMTATDMSKSLGDEDEAGPKEVDVAEVPGTQTDDTEKVEESLVQASLDEVTEQVGETGEIKKTGDLEPTAEAPALEINNVTSSSESSILVSESPKELLAVCEAMTGLVKNDESSSKEMNRLKEQLLVLFSAMHEERISLHARLQKQEAELLKSEEKIEMLEDEIEKQLADWDVLEVKLGQADLEIRKLLAENQRLGNDLEVVSKADSNGDPRDFQESKNFSDDIAAAKSELEEP